MAMARRLTLAGQVGLEVDGVAVPAGGLGRPGRVALAYLACERHRPVPRDELAEVLWGEELPASWEQMLRGVAFKIRGALGAADLDGAVALATVAGTYQLQLPAEVAVDVEEAATALSDARTALDAGDAAAADTLAAQAAEIAARHFAPGATGVWVERRQAELRELHLSALEVRAQAALARAEWLDALVAAEEAVALEPYRESAYQLLMAAHAGAGNRGAALEAYERCRAVLTEALGVNPSPATDATYLRLLGDEGARGLEGSAQAPALVLPRALAAAPGSFVVGRVAETNALAAAFKRATVDGRHAVLVAGEPGVGKTTLVAHGARLAYGEGARVLYGRCDEDLGVAYQPFAQALAQYVLGAPVGELIDHVAAHGGELMRLVPALARRLPGTAPPYSVDADSDRWRLFEAVVGLLRRAAVAAPVVLVLDDLHWAAPATLQLLRHLLASDDAERLLVVVTYRDSEVGRDHPLTAALADLRRQPGVEWLSLRGLDEAGVEAFVAATSGDAEDPAPLARALWSHTAGNPFFVGELLRHLGETGAVFRRAGPWRYYSGDAQLDVPAGVVDVVGRRLGRLSEDANRALTLAAVVGIDFDLDVLERAAGQAESDATLDAVEEGVAARLVVEVGTPGSYRFAHALVRDALCGRLGAARRARLHRLVGEAIESGSGEDGDRLPALAHHFAEAATAGCAEKAADYAVAAADHALALPAADAAVAILQRGLGALDALRPPDHQRRVAVLLALSQALYRDGRNDEGRDVARLAAGEAGAYGMVDELAEAACLQAVGVGGQGQRQEPIGEALDALGDRSPSLRARLLAALATVRVPFDEVSDRLSEEALELAYAVGDEVALGYVLYRRWTVLLGTPDAAGLLAIAEELVTLHTNDQHPGFGYDERVISRLINGDRAGFDADVQLLERLGRETRAWGPRSNAARWRVVQADMDGRFEEVQALADRADEVFAEKRTRRPASHRASTLLWNQGRFQDLLEVSRRGATGGQDFAPVYRGWLAVARAGTGDSEGARADLTDLTDALPGTRRVMQMGLLANLVEVATALHDRDHAGRLYGRLLPYAGQVVTGMPAYCFGSVDRHLGMLAATLERWDDAEGHFENALPVDAGLSAPPLLCRTQYWYGRALRQRPGGDRDRSTELLTAAGRTAEQLGMTALTAQVEQLTVR